MDFCLALAVADCEDDVVDRVEAGEKAYDGTGAALCLADLESHLADCHGDYEGWPASCNLVVTGRLGEGGKCDLDEDCLEHLFCWRKQCSRQPVKDEPCFDNWYCAEGLFCRSGQTCRPAGEAGEPCPEGYYSCAAGLFCDYPGGTCEPFLKAGDYCVDQYYQACELHLYCSYQTQTCQPYPGEGGNCWETDGICLGGYYCGDEGKCMPQSEGGSECDQHKQCLSGRCSGYACEAADSICLVF